MSIGIHAEAWSYRHIEVAPKSRSDLALSRHLLTRHLVSTKGTVDEWSATLWVELVVVAGIFGIDFLARC